MWGTILSDGCPSCAIHHAGSIPPTTAAALAADAPVSTVAAAQQVAQSAERVQSAAKKVKQAADQVTQAANLVKLATDEALLALEDAVKILQMQVATQQGPMPPEVKAVVAQVRVCIGFVLGLYWVDICIEKDNLL